MSLVHRCLIFPAVAFCVFALLGLAGCRKGDGDAPVPRRHAFYRLVLPDSTYCITDFHGYSLSLNTVANTSFNAEKGWLTVSYPDLNTELYVTLTPVASVDEDKAIDNRLERLSMNTGGAYTEITELTNGHGIGCTMLVTPYGSPTPVQFIAVDPGRCLISGSAMVEGIAVAPGDSLSPIVDMLSRDVLHLLEQL